MTTQLKGHSLSRGSSKLLRIVPSQSLWSLRLHSADFVDFTLGVGVP
jgi:hypothetical protein